MSVRNWSPPAAGEGVPPDATVHLIGIGGAGMSALAQLLVERGQPVSGSDLRGGRACAALEALGAVIHVGHDAAQVEGADLVAVSTAIPDTNPELRRALELGLPVWHRAELLARLMHTDRRILVAGTHGKTTTTSMAVVALQAAGLDPSFAIGGTIHDSGTSAHHGTDAIFVAEADESDRSFLAYRPDCAIVTNVELDHHDQYRDLGAVDEAFAAFLANRLPAGVAVVCRDDQGAARLLTGPGEFCTYGTHPDADVLVTDVEQSASGTAFRLLVDGDDLGRLRLGLPGLHNVRNAAAALTAVHWAGGDLLAAGRGLAGFSGAQRRFQRIGAVGGVVIVDDYAHHPTEIVATLEAGRQAQQGGRVVAVFQPHRYSRTAALGAELGQALASADVVVVSDVYGSGEQPVPGVTGAIVAQAATAAGRPALFVHARSDLVAAVAALVQPGDLVLTLGAGDITELGPQLLQELEERRG